MFKRITLTVFGLKNILNEKEKLYLGHKGGGVTKGRNTAAAALLSWTAGAQVGSLLLFLTETCIPFTYKIFQKNKTEIKDIKIFTSPSLSGKIWIFLPSFYFFSFPTTNIHSFYINKTL